MFLSTYKDVTIKMRVSDFNPVTQMLACVGAEFVGIDHQEDTYFKTDKGKLKLRQGTIENLITHYERILEKEIEKTVVYRYDVNPSLDQIEELKKNFQPIGVVKKQRAIYLIGIHKIHLDSFEQGCFIELNRLTETERLPTMSLALNAWI